MIRRAKAVRNCSLSGGVGDSLYGRSSEFRKELRQEDLRYMAAIPNNLRVYLEQPVVGVPEPKPGKKGPKVGKIQVLNDVRSYSVKQVGAACRYAIGNFCVSVPTNGVSWKTALQPVKYGCGDEKQP